MQMNYISFLCILAVLSAPLAGLTYLVPMRFGGAGAEGDGLFVTEFFVAQYPEILRRARLQGCVRMQLQIDRSGNVKAVEVLRGSNPHLVPMARASVEKWKFGPSTSLPAELVIEFNYSFEGEPAENVRLSQISADLPTLVRIKTNPPPTQDGDEIPRKQD